MIAFGESSNVLRDVRYGAAVYGSFLVASVIAVANETGASARTMTLSALGSSVVFWLAHAWSETVGAHIKAGRTPGRRDVLAIAHSEWPLVEAACVPTLLLALAWAGVWSRETGAALALVASVLQIGAWGSFAALRAGGTLINALVGGAGQAVLGVVLLVLERLVH